MSGPRNFGEGWGCLFPTPTELLRSCHEWMDGRMVGWEELFTIHIATCLSVLPVASEEYLKRLDDCDADVLPNLEFLLFPCIFGTAVARKLGPANPSKHISLPIALQR